MFPKPLKSSLAATTSIWKSLGGDQKRGRQIREKGKESSGGKTKSRAGGRRGERRDRAKGGRRDREKGGGNQERDEIKRARG